jgi:hypothetical protein
MSVDFVVPVVPEAAGINDCPECRQAFILTRLTVDGDVKVLSVTRNGAITAIA